MRKILFEVWSGVLGNTAFKALSVLMPALSGVLLALWGRAFASWSLPAMVGAGVGVAAGVPVSIAACRYLWLHRRALVLVSAPADAVTRTDAGSILAQHVVGEGERIRD